MPTVAAVKKSAAAAATLTQQSHNNVGVHRALTHDVPTTMAYSHHGKPAEDMRQQNSFIGEVGARPG